MKQGKQGGHALYRRYLSRSKGNIVHLDCMLEQCRIWRKTNGCSHLLSLVLLKIDRRGCGA